MILETATVTSVEQDALWVEAVQKSACETCTAQKGCGTAVLSKLTGRISRLRVLKPKQITESYSVGQQVTIAIPEDVVVLASICAYLVPLGTSLIGLWLMGSSDILSVVGAALGLAFGGGLVSLYNAKLRDDPRFNPVLYQADTAQEAISLS
ncbi:MAG: SoxR reducing system RseC family protein [Porticoccaceae bacterium]|jgi:sigma-E factor negative regulatory protein RseC